MTLLAFPSKWGFRGAKGFTNLAEPSAARDWEEKKSAPSSPARATEVNPAPASQRNSRRVRLQKFDTFISKPTPPTPRTGGVCRFPHEKPPTPPTWITPPECYCNNAATPCHNDTEGRLQSTAESQPGSAR